MPRFPGSSIRAPLIALARARGCRIYLPRIDRHSLGRNMRFVAMTGGSGATASVFTSPKARETIGARWLDVVFLPLVGFDSCGVRLGTGGGYYDRAFAFRRWRCAWHAPQLVGLAYSFQQVEGIIAAAHDVLTRCGGYRRRDHDDALLADENRARDVQCRGSRAAPRAAPPPGTACAITRRATCCATR